MFPTLDIALVANEPLVDAASGAGMRQAEADRAAATAPTAQRDAELGGARRHLARSERLAPRGVVSAQTYDDDRARVRGSEAAVSAAQAQVAAADAALATARSKSSARRQSWAPHERRSSASRRTSTTARSARRATAGPSIVPPSRARCSPRADAC